jgi:hypothetical protein
MRKILSPLCLMILGMSIAIAQHTIKIEVQTDNYGSETT